MSQVLDRRLQTGPKGGKLLGGDGQQHLGRVRIGGGGKGVQIDHRPVPQQGGELGEGQGQLAAGAIQQPPLQQGLHVLIQLPLPGLGPVSHPGAFGEYHTGISGEIVGGGSRLWVDQRQIAVHSREGTALGNGLPVLLQGGCQLL